MGAHRRWRHLLRRRGHAPEEDPPDVTLKEHLRVIYEDGNWYASHTLQLIGVVLVAAALVALARSGALTRIRNAQRAGVVAAVGAVGWASPARACSAGEPASAVRPRVKRAHWVPARPSV